MAAKYSVLCSVFLFLSYVTQSYSQEVNPLTTDYLFHQVYSDVFRLQDGSVIGTGRTRAVDAMQSSVRRLLAIDANSDILRVSRTLDDEFLLRVLFLAVVGNFTTDQTPSALPQRCALVVDAASGNFVLKDHETTQSIILEILLIISIICLVRAWGVGGTR
jgi:hypothetical protein